MLMRFILCLQDMFACRFFKLILCFQAGYAVILIFSVQGSGHFQGYARFLGHTSAEKLPDLQSQGQGSGSGIQVLVHVIHHQDYLKASKDKYFFFTILLRLERLPLTRIRQVTRKCNGNLNTGQVWYSNGQSKSGSQMF